MLFLIGTLAPGSAPAMDSIVVSRPSLPRGFGGVSPAAAALAGKAFPGGVTREAARRAGEVFRSKGG